MQIEILYSLYSFLVPLFNIAKHKQTVNNVNILTLFENLLNPNVILNPGSLKRLPGYNPRIFNGEITN